MVWTFSSFMLEMQGFKIFLLIQYLAIMPRPIPWINRAFASHIHWGKENFNSIDVLVITHDDYDHLDYPTIIALKDKVKQFVVPLGVGSHLRFWGVRFSKVRRITMVAKPKTYPFYHNHFYALAAQLQRTMGSNRTFGVRMC